MFISSIIGKYPSSLASVGCPFLIIVMGLPSSPVLDQLLPYNILLVLAVLPSLTLFPHLPSVITSPANANRGCILDLSIKVPPTSGELYSYCISF